MTSVCIRLNLCPSLYLEVAEGLIACIGRMLQHLRKNHKLLPLLLLLQIKRSLAEASGADVEPVLAVFVEVRLRERREHQPRVDEKAREKVILLNRHEMRQRTSLNCNCQPLAIAEKQYVNLIPREFAREDVVEGDSLAVAEFYCAVVSDLMSVYG